MSHKLINSQAYRLLNHGPTTLISTAHNGRRNIMAAAWVTPLDFDPPRVTIVIDRNTYTRELLDASGSFVINVPCVMQASLVRALGTSSGRDLAEGIDKFNLYQLTTRPAQLTEAPLLEGCIAWLECKVISEPHIQNTYDLFIAEVVAAYADERVFSDGRWHFEGYDDLRTIHHVAGGAFFATGKVLYTTP